MSYTSREIKVKVRNRYLMTSTTAYSDACDETRIIAKKLKETYLLKPICCVFTVQGEHTILIIAEASWFEQNNVPKIFMETPVVTSLDTSDRAKLHFKYCSQQDCNSGSAGTKNIPKLFPTAPANGSEGR
jgi:hypothetical protein